LTDAEMLAVTERGVAIRREAIQKAAAKGIRKEHDLVGLMRKYLPNVERGTPFPPMGDG